MLVGPGVSDNLVSLLLDPQTSGGLFAAIAPAALPALQADCAARGVSLWRVGRVAAGAGVVVE